MKLAIDPKEFIWEQKYRPQSIADCILPAKDKEMFEGIIKDGVCPSMTLVSKSPGTGKTTVARALVADLDADMYFVNGADCKIDFIRNELTRFASTMTSKKGGKIIVIDEFDRKQLWDAQRHLRSFIEAYSHNCSVIITANDADGIIQPLKSRCPVVQFGNPTPADKVDMMKQMILRCKAILENEGVVIEDLKVIGALVKSNFPDFRQTVNVMSQYAKRGVIDSGILAAAAQASDIEELMTALKERDFVTLKNLSSRYTHDYGSFITKLYNTLYERAVPKSIPGIIMTIGENQKFYQQVANLEIHIQFLLIQLMMETQWK
ncbi:MAG: AAA family ATPase [Aeromonas veronii]